MCTFSRVPVCIGFVVLGPHNDTIERQSCKTKVLQQASVMAVSPPCLEHSQGGGASEE